MLLSIVKFTYNNNKNASVSNTSYELNYSYYLCILYKKNINPYLKFQTIYKLIAKS